MTALDYCTLSCGRAGSGLPPQTHAGGPNPWQIEVEAGQYELAASFPGGEYPNRPPKTYTILPPFVRYTL